MDTTITNLEIIDLIKTGESSTVEIKQDSINQDSLSQEIVAFANTEGGIIIFGIEDNSDNIIGLKRPQADDIDKKVANITNDSIKPFINIITKKIIIEEKMLLLIFVPKGINKPYNARGAIYVRQASTKRVLTDKDEILRLYQSSGNLYADEMPIYDASVDDINEEKFRKYFQKIKKRNIEEDGLTFEKALQIKRILLKGNISLGGLLFFGNNPQFFKTSFCIKAISFFGNELSSSDYKDSINIEGTIPDMFERGMKFFDSNLLHTQQGQSFNSTGKLEISNIAIEELLQNALLHRDYFKNAPIRLMVFDNRIEIISPGKLPNGLTIEELRYSNPVPRNNLLIAYATDAMLFRGYGTGISRAYSEQSNIELINNIDGEQFIVKIPRPEKKSIL